MITDAHHHFFTKEQYEKTFRAFGSPNFLRPLLRNFTPMDFEPILKKHGVNRTILIQIEQVAEQNDEMLNTAEKYPWIAGVVGWVDLKSADLENILISLLQTPKMKGIRHPLQLESDPNWALDPSVLAGLSKLAQKGLVFDLLMAKPHWSIIPKLAKAIPNLSLVIEHFGKPDLESNSIEDWAQAMAAAAEFPNVFCKLSGIMVLLPIEKWGSWEPHQLQPYFDQLFEIFGEDRLMFASDWPVSTLTGTFEQVLDGTLSCLARFSKQARRKILDENAQCIYKL